MTDLHANRNRAVQGDLPREEMYREWLGIADPTPSHYTLLGVPELETDSSAIQHAGRRVKRKLRAYQIGIYRKQALELLAEVGQAVAVLTNPEKKKAYDRGLMDRWRGLVEDLYQTHCRSETGNPAAVEAWLGACAARSVPVTRLMPHVMRRLYRRARGWPVSGEHRLGLPVNLWVYRDAVVLGQCLHVGTLETRVEAVKSVQKTLAIPEGLARLVAEEVARSLHLFSKDRIVARARRDPDAVLVRLGRRIRRHGGSVGEGGQALAAIARLLGKSTQDLQQTIEKVNTRAVELSASRVVRRGQVRLATLGRRALAKPGRMVDWIADRPQVMIGLAVTAGAMAVLVACLVVAGILQPWNPPAPVTPPETGRVAEAPSGKAAPARPDDLLPTLPRIEDAPPDWVKQWREKYPVGETEAATPPVPGVEPGGKTTTEVKFFGVDGGKRPGGKGANGKGAGGGNGTNGAAPE